MTGIVEAFIFCALLYWIFSIRAYSMVDMVAGTIHKVYTTLDSMVTQRPHLSEFNDNLEERLTKAGLDRLKKTLPRNVRRLARKKTSLLDQNSERTIYEDLPLEVQNIVAYNPEFLCGSPFMAVPPDKPRPIMGGACRNCTQTGASSSLVSKVTHQYAIQNVLAVEAQNSNRGYLEQLFCHLTTVWRLKTHYYPQVYKTVLDDERLKDAIKSAADEEYKELETNDDQIYQNLLIKHESRAVQIINGMRTSISDFLLRITAWLVYKLIPRFIMSVSSQPAQIELLRQSHSVGLPLIFLPLHRSHLDYILITFILLCNNIQAPLVAAGDNLKIPFFGWLLRGLGAFFIKRRMDPVQGRRDTVYRAVLHTYMMECLRAGHNIEFFIEGGRTRTGKTCMPKGGLLSVIVDAYMDGTIHDALLVPVSLNYEKLVDGNFVREQLGQPKEMESFTKAINAIWSVLNSNYGMMRIDFHQPFSLKELISSMQGKRRIESDVQPPILVDEGDGHLKVMERAENFHHTPSSTSLYGTDICHEEHRQVVESIARHVIYDCSKATAVMSTNAVAFLLLHKYRNGVSFPRLVSAVTKLREELRKAHRDVGFSGESMDVVNHALDLLGPGLIRKEKMLKPLGSEPTDTETVTMITPITMLPNVIELSYYSNSLLSHYILDSVVVTAMYSMLGDDLKDLTSESTLYVYHGELKRSALLICDILQYEFIFAKPCQNIDNLVSDAIENLQHMDILVTDKDGVDEDTQWSRRLAKHLDEEWGPDFSDNGSSSTYDRGIEYKLVRNQKIMAHLEFLHSLIRPLIDTYTISALCLSRLVGRQLTERDYAQEVLGEMKMQLERGVLHYGESVAVDPIKASFKLFEHWQVLECHSEDRVKLYYLSDTYDKESEVKKVFEMVSQFKWGPKCDIEQFSQE